MVHLSQVVGQVDGGDHFFAEWAGPTTGSGMDDFERRMTLTATTVQFGYRFDRDGHRASEGAMPLGKLSLQPVVGNFCLAGQHGV